MSNARVQTIITNAGPTRRVDYLPPGAGKQFHAGETLTLSGLLEEDLHLADDHRLDRFLHEQAQGLITVSYVVGGNSVPSLTQGSVAFGGLGGVITEDNDNLFYDATGKQLGVGLGGSAPTSTIDMGGVYTARGISTPAVSAAGTGTLYFDSGSNTFQVSENGGPYVPLISGGSSAFNAITTGDNTTATMTVGSGAQMLTDPGAVFGVSTAGTDNMALGSATTGAALSINTLRNTIMGVGAAALFNYGVDNVFIGYNAGTLITPGGGPSSADSNTVIGSGAADLTDYIIGCTIIGFRALRNATNAATNCVAIGYQAMSLGNPDGSSQIAIGAHALDAITTGGGNNVAIGGSALASATTAVGNVAMGYSAMNLLVAGSANVAIGFEAMMNNNSGNSNVTIGTQVMHSATDGDSNVAIGHSAMYGLVDGDRNTAVGYSALYGTGGSVFDNTAYGYQAMMNAATGAANNIGIGQLALSDTSGQFNVAVGDQALQFTGVGTYNVAIGYIAMANASFATNNVAVGDSALQSVLNGTFNVAIGSSSMQSATGMNFSVAVGALSLQNVTSDGNVAVGYSALRNLAGGVANTAVGRAAGTLLSSGTNNTFVGDGVAITGDMNNCVFIGASAGAACVADNNTGVGAGALENLSSGTFNVAVGAGAGLSLTTGSKSVIIGENAFNAATADDEVVMIGYLAGLNQAVGGASGNTFVGVRAGENSTTGTHNTFFGFETGQSVVGAVTDNTFVGYQAGKAATGIKNTFVGSGAGAAVAGGHDNVYIGYFAGNGLPSDFQNVAIGSQAGQVVSGNDDVFVGFQSGINVTTGTHNITIGSASAPTLTTGTGNILLGAGVDVVSSGDSALFVAGSFTSPTNDIYFGQGIASAAPTMYTIHGTGGSGSGVNGADLVLAGGVGGTAADTGGKVRIQTASAGAGTTLVDRIVVLPSGNVGIGGSPGAFQLDVFGNTQIQGKLTVTGGIDPTFLELAGTSVNTYLNMTNGSSTPVSAPNEGRIIYNDITQTFQISADGSPYESIIPGGTSSSSGSGTPTKWSDLLDPLSDLMLSMMSHTTHFMWNATTGAGVNLFTFADANANTGTGYLVSVKTGTGSSLKPFRVVAAGTEVFTVLANGNIGINGSPGAFNLDVNGPTRIQGKLTVTGGIDPTFLELAGTSSDTYLNMTDGSTVPVSAPNEGRLIYNEVLQRFQLSENGGAYVDILGSQSSSSSSSSEGLSEIHGYGTVGNIPVFLGVHTIGDSPLIVSGTNVGINCTPGAFNLDVNGPTRVQGKLTVTGGIDPTFLELAGATNNTYLNMTAGDAVSVSPPNQGRIIYNAVLQKFQASENSGTFVDLIQSSSSSSSGPSGPVSFADITSGTNTTATMTVGTGAAIKVSGTGTIGLSSVGSGTSNIVLGSATGSTFTSANHNVLVGYQTGAALTSDSDNVMIGYQAGYLMAASSGQNVFVGSKVAASLTTNTGTRLVMIGYNADVESVGATNQVIIGSDSHGAGSQSVTIGHNVCSTNVTNLAQSNVVIGDSAGASLSDGINNVLIGSACCGNLSTGEDCVYVGANSNSYGTRNTCIGASTGGGGLGAADNVIMGSHCSTPMQPGAQMVLIGSKCVGTHHSVWIGYNAGGFSGNPSGVQQVVIGRNALSSGTASGSDNVFIGDSTSTIATSAAENVVIGSSGGAALTTGSNNTLIGKSINVAAGSTSDAIILGHGSSGASSAVIIGVSITSSTVSDFYIASGDSGLQRTAASILAITNGTSGPGAQEFIGAASSTFAVSPSNNGRIFFNSTLQRFQVSENGGPYVDLLGGSSSSSSSSGDTDSFSIITTGMNNQATMDLGVGSKLRTVRNGVVCFELETVSAVLTGVNNHISGAHAGESNTSGAENTFYGYKAGQANVTASRNTYMGFQAGYLAAGANDTDNTCIGWNAGLTMNGGFGQNTCVGAYAGEAIYAGYSNTFVGYGAGGLIAGYSGNTGIGDNCNMTQSGGNNSTVVGSNSYAGDTCIVIGHGSGFLDPSNTGTNNIIIGNDSCLNIQDASQSVYIGDGVKTTAPSDPQEVIIGYQAGNTSDTGGDGQNVLIGYQAGMQVGSSQNTLIGWSIAPAVISGSNNTGIGAGSFPLLTGGADNVIVGSNAFLSLTTGSSNTAIGDASGLTVDTGSNNVFVGAGASLSGGSSSNAIAIGVGAVAWDSCISIGYQAGNNAYNGDRSTFIGYQSGLNMNSGNANTLIGYQTGTTLGVGSSNVFIGDRAGVAATDGSNNVFIGSIAGFATTVGVNNVCVGASAGQSMAGANDNYNVLIGSSAGVLMNGASGGDGENTAIGTTALSAMTTGRRNVGIGSACGLSNVTSNWSVLIGYLADVHADPANNALVISSSTNGAKASDTSIVIVTQTVDSAVSNDFIIESGVVGLRRALGTGGNDGGVLRITDGGNGTGAGALELAGIPTAFEPPTAPANCGRIYYNSDTNLFMFSSNTGAYVALTLP